MALSGTVTFSLNRDQLLTDAMIDAGIVGIGQEIESNVMEFASRTLNSMLKLWQTEGLKLWKTKEVTLFFEKSVNNYTLGPSGSHATLSPTKTEIRVAAVATDTILEVDSTTGMIAGDNIGIELDDNTFHWTTIDSVTDSDTVVITTAIPTGDSVAIDSDVWFYTNKITRPLEIFTALVRDQDDEDRPIDIIARKEYYNFGSKDNESTVTQIYFDPQLTTAKLRTYPTPSTSVERLIASARFAVEDLTSAAQDFDLPQEWYLPVRLNLAVLLTPAASTESFEFKKLKILADETKEAAMGWDNEQNVSVYLQPADPRRAR